jgi:hypothetical protein
MANIPKHHIQKEYASWVATPRRLKVSLGLPQTKQAFADMKGVSVRTLTRWEGLESFQELVSQRQIELANSTPNSTVRAVGPPRPAQHGNALKKFEVEQPATSADDPVYDERLTPDEISYRQVKDTLLRLASDGNQGAIDLYMKHYGKPFIEAEQKAGTLFPTMTNDMLEAAILAIIGDERISHHLSERVVNA